MTRAGVASESEDDRQRAGLAANEVKNAVTLAAGVVECGCGELSPCASLQSAVVEHTYLRDDHHEWLVDAAERLWKAMLHDGLADRSDLLPHTWQWLRAVADVVAGQGVVESLVASLWALDRHDVVAAWDEGEDLPYELRGALDQLAAMTGLWLTLDGRVACPTTLPAVGRQLLSCQRLGGWPRQTTEFDTELAEFVAVIP